MTGTNRRQRSKWIIWLFPWAGRPASLHNSSLIPIAPPSMSEGFSRVSSKGVILTHNRTRQHHNYSRWFLDWIKNTFFLLKNSNGLSSKAFSAWLIHRMTSHSRALPRRSRDGSTLTAAGPHSALISNSVPLSLSFFSRGVISCCFSRPGRKWLARNEWGRQGWWWRHATQNT